MCQRATCTLFSSSCPVVLQVTCHETNNQMENIFEALWDSRPNRPEMCCSLYCEYKCWNYLKSTTLLTFSASEERRVAYRHNQFADMDEESHSETSSEAERWWFRPPTGSHMNMVWFTEAQCKYRGRKFKHAFPYLNSVYSKRPGEIHQSTWDISFSKVF